MKMIKIIVAGIMFLGCTILGGYLYLDNQKIVKTNGVYDDKSLMLKNGIWENEPEFSENIVVAKLLNNKCVEVNTTETLIIKQDILANRKILDAVIGMVNRFKNNELIWAWYINKNLEKERNSDNFTTIYFSDFTLCEAFSADRSSYQKRYQDAKNSQKYKFEK